ncbi:MAG: protein phosphatase CheZ [Pseudomonadota bacterium]|nr:protein phosphatase CheZ [Pseudomonadota bacterium]
MSESLNVKRSGEEVLYGREQVIQIVNSVIAKVEEHHQPPQRDVLSEQLISLREIIEEARAQLVAARPGDIRGVHIPNATDELDAVVGATEEATGVIMDSCEHIQAQLSGVPQAISQEIDSQIIKIFEACSFQDITGQRITKVIKALQEIDIKISALLGETTITAEMSQPQQADIDKPETLLNGPQMSDQAITQDDIDALLASFND